MSEVTSRAPSRGDERDQTQARTTSPDPTRPPDVAGGGDGVDAEVAHPLPRRWRILQVLVTLCAAVLASYACWLLWNAYMASPWTRDGTVRVYVVTVAPEVAGQIVDLPVRDNQYVHKGDLLMRIDPRDYRVSVDLSQAALDQAQADFVNKQSQAARRLQLTDLATTPEQKEQYVASAKVAQATVEQRKANLDRAEIDMERTEIRAPVNGWVTNLLTRQGNYATTGATALSVVDADSFWVDGYFEETTVAPIREGDPARVYLLGYRRILRGHVDSVARGIVVPNAQPGTGGLANVNPIFTWVRLAQRVPVRVHVDEVPPEVRLVAGMTATVEVDVPAGPRAEPVADTGAGGANAGRSGPLPAGTPEGESVGDAARFTTPVSRAGAPLGDKPQPDPGALDRAR